MRFYEIVSEVLSGTVGTTPSTVQPSFKSGTTPPQKSTTQPNADPKLQQLATTLKINKIVQNDKDISNFISGYQAKQNNKPLTPDQEKTMANLAGALLKDKSLDQKLDLQLKTISQQPGNNTTSTQTTSGM